MLQPASHNLILWMLRLPSGAALLVLLPVLLAAAIASVDTCH